MYTRLKLFPQNYLKVLNLAKSSQTFSQLLTKEKEKKTTTFNPIF